MRKNKEDIQHTAKGAQPDEKILPENILESEDFSVRSRQSGVAILLILIRLVKSLARQFWPILLIILFNPNRDGDYFYLKIFGGLAAFAAVRSIIGWFRYYFYIKDDELVIEKGVFGRSKLNVPIDRVQTVNFSQNILHQFFNVVSVEIDTAGSSGNEFVLQALNRQKAEALRDYIESQKRDLAPTEIIEETFVPKEEKRELILQLKPIDLVKIGVSQNHLRTAGIITAFFWSFIDDIEEAFNWKFMDAVEQWMTGGSSFLKMLLIFVPFFLLVSFILTLVNSVLRDYNFQFWKTETGFKIQSGLFNKKENSANLYKIQLLRWTTNPLKRYFKLATLRLSQAASRVVSRKTAITVPGIYSPELEKVQQIWFPSWLHLDNESHGISRLIVWRKVLYQGIVPALVLTGVFWFNIGWKAFFWLLLILVIFIWARRFQATWIYEINEEGIRTNSGVIQQTHVLLQWYKIQGVRIRQGLYQQRKGLADLVFYTAAGSVAIPYIKVEKAEMLRDYVIFKVEMDRRKWM